MVYVSMHIFFFWYSLFPNWHPAKHLQITWRDSTDMGRNFESYKWKKKAVILRVFVNMNTETDVSRQVES
jgi:hypothetical protein